MEQVYVFDSKSKFSRFESGRGYGFVAQQVEQGTEDPRATGSIPVESRMAL